MNYRILRTFLAVAHTGSFAAAATRVALTQAAVSIQMRTLEQTLGTTLFEKQGRTLTLSPKGLEILPKIEQIVGLTTELFTPVIPPSSRLSLGAVVSVLSTLSLLASHLKKTYPQLDIRLIYGRSNELQQMVLDGELDVAYLIGQKETPLKTGLVWSPLYQEPYVVLAPADAQVSSIPELFNEFGFITFDHNTRTGKEIETLLLAHKLRPQRHFELNAIDTIVTLVKQGVGISLLPKLQWAEWDADPKLKIYHLPPPVAYREIGMIRPNLPTHLGLLNTIEAMFPSLPL